MKKISILASLILSSSLIYANNTPVTVSMYISSGAHILSVQSNEDRVTIQNVSVNRGNCSIQDRAGNRTLKFGDEKTYYLIGCEVSRVKEVQVSTDLGTITFSTN